MHPFLTTLALNEFPRRETSQIPHVDMLKVWGTETDPSTVWSRVTTEINFSSFQKIVQPSMLDQLFSYISKKVDQDRYPKGFGIQSKNWFKHILPHCRRDVYKSKHTPNMAFQRADVHPYRAKFSDERYLINEANWKKELELNHFCAQNPPPEWVGSWDFSDHDYHIWLFQDTLSQERLEYFSNLDSSGRTTHSVQGFSPEAASPYILLAPKITDDRMITPDVRENNLCVPQSRHWKLWYEDMLLSLDAIKGFAEIRDFCYNIELSIQREDTPEGQKDYLVQWIKSMYSNISV